jgi:hypothetical protein
MTAIASRDCLPLVNKCFVWHDEYEVYIVLTLHNYTTNTPTNEI